MIINIVVLPAPGEGSRGVGVGSSLTFRHSRNPHGEVRHWILVCLPATDTLLSHAPLHLEIPEETADCPRTVVRTGGHGIPECVDQDLYPEPLLRAPGATGMLTGP